MQVSLTPEEVRQYIRIGILEEIGKETAEVVLHKNGGASAYLYDSEGEADSDEEA